MNKILTSLILLLFTIQLSAQVEFGVKAGMNSIDLISNSINFKSGSSDFDLKFQESKYGHHFGLYSRIKILGIYIEPAAIFNSNTVTYSLEEYSEQGVFKSLKNETYNKLDIPLMVGIKAGILRLYAGPVGHIHIGSSSDLIDVKGYKQKFNDASYGYQVGFGLDIWKLRFELTYEGNLSKFGDHITIGGNDYSFGDPASRLMGTVGYAF